MKIKHISWIFTEIETETDMTSIDEIEAQAMSYPLVLV